MKKNNIEDIARWFLHQKEMTHKKLQKLLYFSYGIYLAENNESEEVSDSMFENNFEAWVHGPVDPNIYNQYKNYGINLIFIEQPITFDFNEKTLQALNITIEKYGEYSADQLENISHNQLPWMTARIGLQPIEPSANKLDDKLIYKTFKQII